MTMSSRRIRLHWFIGSFFILLFIFLLMFRLGVIEKGEEDGDYLLPIQVQADRETWMNIYQKEQKIGYVHRQIFKTRGTLKDKTLTLSMASGTGPEQRLNLPLKKDIHLSVGLLEILSARDLKPGDSRTFTVFDPITATERSVKILVVEEETILVMDREERAKKVSVEFMGVSQFAWIGKDGA